MIGLIYKNFYIKKYENKPDSIYEITITFDPRTKYNKKLICDSLGGKRFEDSIGYAFKYDIIGRFDKDIR